MPCSCPVPPTAAAAAKVPARAAAAAWKPPVKWEKASACQGDALLGPCCWAGHWLGMDTHDTRSVTHNEPMREGVVLTVEPGLYVPADPQRFGPYAGIGVRIEDDVAVTAGGPEVLSADVPVAACDVERLAGTRPSDHLLR